MKVLPRRHLRIAMTDYGGNPILAFKRQALVEAAIR